MSYILDALQRSSTDKLVDGLPSQPQKSHAGLALPWKIAIGAVLATNLLFLYLWQTDARNTERSVVDASSTQQPLETEPASLTNQDYYPPQPASPNTRKKTLPGIASPRELPPTPTQSQNFGQSTQPLPATAKTFRPTGAPITIADPPTPGNSTEPQTARELAAQALMETAPQSQSQSQLTTPSTTGTEREPEQLLDSTERTGLAANGVSQLHELSDSAREALYVLTFSFHIYSEDADLRAVVVNGKRLSEGSNVIAENGQSFRLLEIFDTGVVMQFDHEGATETVEIPVIEDWKEA